MRRRGHIDPNWALIERERYAGGAIALEDWNAGERTPLSQRDQQAWAALNAREKHGYEATWIHESRQAERLTICCDKHATVGASCPVCWREGRDALVAEFAAAARGGAA